MSGILGKKIRRYDVMLMIALTSIVFILTVITYFQTNFSAIEIVLPSMGCGLMAIATYLIYQGWVTNSVNTSSRTSSEESK